MYRLANNQISSNFTGQTTILEYQAGIYYGLNEVGTFVWEILQKSPAEFGDLKAAVTETFDVDEDVCVQDLKDILNKLINAGLVEQI